MIIALKEDVIVNLGSTTVHPARQSEVRLCWFPHSESPQTRKGRAPLP